MQTLAASRRQLLTRSAHDGSLPPWKRASPKAGMVPSRQAPCSLEESNHHQSFRCTTSSLSNRRTSNRASSTSYNIPSQYERHTPTSRIRMQNHSKPSAGLVHKIASPYNVTNCCSQTDATSKRTRQDDDASSQDQVPGTRYKVQVLVPGIPGYLSRSPTRTRVPYVSKITLTGSSYTPS